MEVTCAVYSEELEQAKLRLSQSTAHDDNLSREVYLFFLVLSKEAQPSIFIISNSLFTYDFLEISFISF